MFRKVTFNCIKLCLLVIICTADPFQLPDERTSDEKGARITLRHKDIAKNKGNDEEIDEQHSDMTQENVPVASANSEEEDKISDSEKKKDTVTAEEVSDVTNNENNYPLDDDVTDAASNNKNDPQDASSSKENNVLPPFPSDDIEGTGQNGCKWDEDKTGVKYDTKKLSLLASFKLNEDEIEKFKIWPKATVPYLIDEFSYGKILRDKIRDKLDHAGSLTGINFQELPGPPDTDDERWVFIVNRRGQLDCQDYTTKSFTNSGVQKVVIGYDCLNNNGHIASVVLALAGVPPQHNAPDRDRFVNVTMESILPDKKHLFKKLGDGDWLFHDLKYDYNSAGHYHTHKYTADGSSTIAISNKIFEPYTFSYTDLQKIRMLYNNIIQNSPSRNIKVHTCQALFPNSNPGNLKLADTRNVVPERPKPKKYLAAQSNFKTVLKHPKSNGEVLSDL